MVRFDGHEVHVVGEILPRAGHAFHLGLAAELSFGTDFLRDAGHLGGEGVQLIHHRVDRVFELEDLAFRVDRDLLRQVAVGDGGRHLRDVAHLGGQVAGETVHVVGQVLPGTGHAFHVGLAAELSFGTHFFRDAGHFGGEGVQLIHHGVDGVLQLEDFAFRVDRDLLRQVALRDGGRHLRDVTNLGGQVAGEAVHVVGQIFPRAGHAFHVGLTAELSFGTDFLRDAGHLGGE